MENELKYCYRYPHPAVTTDCVIFTFHDGQLKVLLVKRGIEPFKGCWALPGGFMRMDESAEECAKRELREETGYEASYIKQFHTFSAPGRDPRERVVTVAFYALVRWKAVEGADDADEAEWISINRIPPLAFDHKDILKIALESLRKEIHFNPVGFELLDSIFSMPELQAVYEAILGREFDRRNFAKKMQHTKVILPVEPEEKKQAAAAEETELPRGLVRKDIQALFGDDEDDDVTPRPSSTFRMENSACEPCVRPCSPQIKTETKKKGRIQKLFRFNRDRYKDMKDSGDLEF